VHHDLSKTLAFSQISKKNVQICKEVNEKVTKWYILWSCREAPMVLTGIHCP